VITAACVGLLLMATAAAANMLANPGFEDGLGLPGWQVFGNAYAEDPIPEEPGNIEPYEGMWLCKMFGNFWCTDCFNVTGVFQEFPTCEGDEWAFSCKSRHTGYDPMQAPNWMVQKIAFFDVGGAEITSAAVESIILDATYLIDTWFDNAAIVGIAPAGAVKMQALILFLQPSLEGGAGQVDNAELLYLGGPSATEQSTWGQIKSLYR
jgi:hypothetical protein